MPDVIPAAPSESATPEITLADEIAEMFGDPLDSDVETPAATPGATPAVDAAAKTEVAAEGKDEDARAGDTPVDATKTDPDKKDEVTDTPDPLATATALTYVVNGESRTFDGIKVLGEHGAIVAPEALELLQRRLGERDHLFESNKELYARGQDFEKLSEFHTKDAEGKDQVLSGTEGLLTARVQLATLSAAYETLANNLRDPQMIASLLSQNEKGELVLNEQGLQRLILQSENAEMKAETAARNHFMTIVTGGGRAAAAESATPAKIDFAKEAPQIIDGAAKAASIDAKLLNDADRKFLSEQLPRYIRQVTAEDRQWNPTLKVGSPIVDAAFTGVVKDRADLRAELAKTVKATTTATDENAKRLAAAALGRKPAAPVVAETKKEDTTRVTDAQTAWALRERAAAAGLGR